MLLVPPSSPVMAALRTLPAELAQFRLVGLGDGWVDAGWSTGDGPPYRSTSHSVIQVTAGRAEVECDGRWFPLEPGQIYLVPALHLLRRRTAGFHHRWLNFTCATLAGDLRLARLDRILACPVAAHQPWIAALDGLAALVAGGAAGAPVDPAVLLRLEGLLLQAVGTMLAAAPPASGTEVAVPVDASADPRVRQAAAWLDQHYRRKPTLAGLARVVGRSPSHLHAGFTATYGISPAIYAERLRLRDAQHLLTATDLPIQEVARRCGYDDPLHFSRVVRRHFQRSPRQVRALGQQT